jgi:hypothetical protein
MRGGYYGRYVPSGHLLYVHQGTVYAAPMDVNRLELTGPAAPVGRRGRKQSDVRIRTGGFLPGRNAGLHFGASSKANAGVAGQ